MKRADLDKIKKNRFGYEEILTQDPEMSYEELHEILEELCGQKRIEPVKKSGKTSFLPQVYREYRKVAVKEDYSALLPEIRGLHTRLSIDRYLANPKEFQEHREHILSLSRLLWQKAQCLEQWMSVKEKSYAIWGDEKFLESRQGRAILAFHGLDREELHYYDTPEPFFCRVLKPGENGDVLILENKDPWYSMERALKESETGTIAGITPGRLVYGEGNKVTRGQEGLTAFLEDIGYQGQRIFYAGDMDRAGIHIFYEMKKQNPRLSVEPCVPLYEAMARRALENRQTPVKSKDKRGLEWEKEFLDYFTSPCREFIQQMLEEHRIIPQEILNYQDYRVMCRGQSC